MRRTDREMPREFALEVVDKCEWAALGLTDTSNKPYCVPVTIARSGGAIYFHSAMEGRKIDCLRHCPDVCLSCVGDTRRMTNEFSTEFESAMVFGTAYEVNDEAEKIAALHMICERHTPMNMANFDEAIQRSIGRTAVWRIDIASVTGKRKKYDPNGEEMKFGRME